MIKPNPCKCGNKNPLVVGYSPVGFLVDCLYCNRYTRPHNTEKGAIQKWNDLYGMKMKLIFEDEDGDGVLTSRNTGVLYRVFPQSNGTFFTPRLYPGSFPTAEAAIEAIRKKYENA